MPTSLVTGGAGFLGSHLCESLLERGHRVICLDNLETGSLANIEHLRDDAFVFMNHDVIEHIAVSEPLDFVFHLAALASPIDYMRLPLHSLKAGSYGTHHTLGLAKVKRARYLLASTSEVYGDPEVHPQRETYWGHVNPVGPRGVYDEAKRYAEALTMAYHSQQGVDTAIVHLQHLRVSHAPNAGARSRPSCARRSRHVRSPSSGTARRPGASASWTISSAASCCSRSPGSICPSTSGIPTRSHCSSWPRPCSASPARRVRSSTRRSPSTIPVRQPDITRAQQILGWEPEVELDDGLRRTIASLGHEAAVSSS